MKAMRFVALTTISVVSVLLLQGCGGGEPTPTDAPTPAPAPTDAPTPVPAPPTCGGTSGTDYCCAMPGSTAQCQETQCNQISVIEAGLAWAVTTGVTNPPAGFVGPPHNRMGIFLLDASAGGHETKSLVLVNGVQLDDDLRRDLQALETAQDAVVRYVLSTGDWHHVFLGDYTDAFPEATVYVPPGRIPEMRKDDLNFTVLDIAAPLPELLPHFQIQNMDGLVQPPLGEGWESSTRNELFFYHQASKTLMSGDLFWVWSCEPSAQDKATWPGIAKGSVSIWNYGGGSIWSTQAERIESARASALALLNLDFTRYIPIHGPLGNGVPADASPSAKALFDAALKGPYGILGGAREQFAV